MRRGRGVNAASGCVRTCPYCGVDVLGNAFFSHAKACREDPPPPVMAHLCELCDMPAFRDDILCWFHARQAGVPVVMREVTI